LFSFPGGIIARFLASGAGQDDSPPDLLSAEVCGSVDRHQRMLRVIDRDELWAYDTEEQAFY
jgi:hypothetical protein